MTNKMTRFAAILTVMLVLAAGTTSWRANAYDVIAQQAAAAPPLVPVKVDIVLSRSQGDKKLSSLPYTIWANASGNNVSLRLGVGCGVDEQLVETLIAIANRTAIDLEDVAKLQPSFFRRQLHQQQIRFELAAFARQPPARAGCS